jgi:protoheme IX farnesyltransferase
MLNNILELTKYRLSLSVIFSSIAGYLIAIDYFSIQIFLLLLFGGFFLVGASNGFNQIIEKERDALMDRTKNRPIPSLRLSTTSAFLVSVSLTLLGIIILYKINPKTALFGAISIFIYTCLYTPLKTKTPLSVFVGAFPGAIPFMLGWVAATNNFGIEAGTLFAIQFFWQFPHFIAISWIRDEEYKNAKFKMMPGKNKSNFAPTLLVIFTILMIITSIIPFFYEIMYFEISKYAFLLIIFLGLFFLLKSFKFLNSQNNSSARKVLLFSYIYLPIVQILYVIDKFLLQ